MVKIVDDTLIVDVTRMKQPFLKLSLTYGRWPWTSNNTRVAWFICRVRHGRSHHHRSSPSFFWDPGRRIILDWVIHLQENAKNRLRWLSLINIICDMWCTSMEDCAYLAVHSRRTRHCSSAWHWRTLQRWWCTTRPISLLSCWLVCRTAPRPWCCTSESWTDIYAAIC